MRFHKSVDSDTYLKLLRLTTAADSNKHTPLEEQKCWNLHRVHVMHDKAHCKRNLTGYKVPRAYFHLDELPQDQMGKVRRRDVQKLLLERLEQRGESVDSLIKKRR